MTITSEFRNEPALELRRQANREAAQQALAELRRRLPLRVADDAAPGATFTSTNPSDPGETIAIAAAATRADAHSAVTLAAAAQPSWSAAGAAQRAATLQRAAGLLRERRLELAALVVLEAGKPWPEADADICEAIDFLEYYAAGALTLAAGRPLLQLPGERNTLHYVARGVCAVISPWNFPVAIPSGMIAAALATGNAVVFKPAEQTPACGHAIVTALHAAGVPPHALLLLCGDDEPAKALVADPHVHTIAFTGSCAAGLEILRTAADVQPGQHHIKRVIAEMGGKNCIIVDADADLDEAIPAIVRSTFQFAGQKCSAASRVLVHEAVADVLHRRLAGAIETLRVGPAEDFASDLGPVIDTAALDRIEAYLAQAELPPAATAAIPTGPGHYVEPTLFVDLPPESRLNREEIFGPVLCSNPVTDVRQALDEIAAGPFGLTAGLFSRSPATIALVSERITVGNLYVNREITGAMVGRQPFGGGHLSGTGPKAGGPDYPLQFVEARSVSENTVRHGLVV